MSWRACKPALPTGGTCAAGCFVSQASQQSRKRQHVVLQINAAARLAGHTRANRTTCELSSELQTQGQHASSQATCKPSSSICHAAARWRACKPAWVTYRPARGASQTSRSRPALDLNLQAVHTAGVVRTSHWVCLQVALVSSHATLFGCRLQRYASLA